MKINDRERWRWCVVPLYFHLRLCQTKSHVHVPLEFLLGTQIKPVSPYAEVWALSKERQYSADLL